MLALYPFNMAWLSTMPAFPLGTADGEMTKPSTRLAIYTSILRFYRDYSYFSWWPLVVSMIPLFRVFFIYRRSSRYSRWEPTPLSLMSKPSLFLTVWPCLFRRCFKTSWTIPWLMALIITRPTNKPVSPGCWSEESMSQGPLFSMEISFFLPILGRPL